jgi:multisubunit Na+/H+ antiporter MnhG subunit
MSKKDKYSKKDRGSKIPGSDVFMSLNESTRRAIGAVVFFVIAIFLFMAALDKAGRVGVMTFNGLDLVLGIGYYLLPVVLVVLAILFLLPRDEEKNVALTQIIGAIALFISGPRSPL